MNSFKFFGLSTILLLTAASADAQEEAKPNRLSEFHALKGCWAVEAEETNTHDEGFKQSGFIAVRPVLDGNGIEIRRHFEVSEATGLYTSLSKVRRSSQEVAFDASSGLLVMMDTRPGVPVPSISKAGISDDGRTVFSTFIFYHPRREMTLFGEDYLKIVSSDEVSSVTEIRNVFGDYRETYTSNWRRLHDNEDACIPDAP